MKRTIKQLLAGLLALALMLTVVPLAIFADDEAAGDITVGTTAELKQLALDVKNGKTYEGLTVTLTADLALGGEADPWMPIGTGDASFKGTFDGNGHIISGLYIASGSSVGLFGNVNGGTVKNLIVRGEVKGSSNVAGVVGKLTAGTVQNCGNEADVSGGSGVGGVVGYVEGDSTISGCYNKGAVSGTTGYIGGVTGQHWRAGVVENCYNAGTVTGPATVGGVTGGHKAASPVLKNCYNAGKMVDSAGNGNNIGAVIGASRGSNTNCYYIRETGTDSKSGVTEAETLTAAMLGEAFKADDEGINGGYPVLTWQRLIPHLILDSYEALKSFAERVNDGETYEGALIRLDVNVYLGGESNAWTAIGTSATPFRGIFDGGYHVVSGLYSSVGFFGNVNGGTVKNLVVRGEVKGSSNIAGVVGKLTAGTVRNCGNEADVSGGANVGGVVGSVNGNCTVSGCYNKGAVTGTTGYIGGVTGQHWRAGVVENCYNAGTVTGPATVGGVTGGHKASSPVLNNCYNAGNMVDSAGSGNNIGAVLGASRGSNSNCYYIRETGTDSKSGVTEAETLTAAMLGGAFADGESLPVLAWEASVCTDSPVRPAFVEGSELSAQLAAYIKAAVKSAKTKGGIGGSLLGDEKNLSGASSTATDWMALAMGRFGYSDDAYVYMIDDGTGYADYLAAMRTYIEQTYAANNGVLHSVKATEWHRAVVAIAALGGDPTNFGTYNGQPINLIADGSYNCALREGPGTQGLNGWIWGLIAMDTVHAEVPENAKYPRARFITEILRMQLTDGVNGNAFGGWVLGGYGTKSDVDMTAMAIQALAPYYNDDTVYTYTNENSKTEVSKTVRECVNEALDVLGGMQNKSGGYTSWGTNNAESVAQVLVALCSLGIDPAKDARFVTADGKTLLDGLLAFWSSEGGFCHTADGGWNSMANDQSTYALVSYWRFENRLRALYDMRGEMTGTDSEAVAAAETAIAAANDPMAAGYKAGLKAALAACRAVSEAERRYVRGYVGLAEAIAMVGGEAELDTDKPFIVSVSITKAPDKTRYTEGNVFDPAGLVITATYSDGHTEPVTDYRLSAPEKLTVADTTVTVFYGALRTSFAIEVAERTPWGGSGTADDPYRIGTAEELAELGEKVGKGNLYTDVTFVLTANIDLSDYPDWVPIGKSSAQFDGIFDGRGYAIDNLYSKNGGLFGYVSTNAVIKNVGVASGRIGAENLSFMGAIAKWSNGADFINCWNGADILCSGWSGGIVGTVRDGGESVIKGCYNIGSVTARDGAIGGIVGHLAAGNNGTAVAVTVSDCYNAGTVTAGDNAGGIVGRVQDGNVIRNCYNIGAVTVNGENILDGAGGIVSLLTSGSTVENCYYDSALTAHGVSNGIDAAADRTAEELKSAAFLARLGEGFKQDRYALENGGYPLLAWQATDAADEADAVTAQIAALGEITLESETAIRAAREAYEALNEAQKACVSGFDLLTSAEARLNELKDAGNPEPEKPEPEKPEPENPEPENPEPEKPEPEKPDDGDGKASDKTVSTMLLAILVGETVILILLAAGVVMLLGSVRKHKDNFWN